MGIRSYTKDNLRGKALPLTDTIVSFSLQDPESDDPLQFWSHHPAHPVAIDLNVFKNGESHAPPSRGASQWRGPFTGRPRLIAQLAPIVRELAEYAAPSTVSQYRFTLRAWWRLFDAVEAVSQGASTPAPRVEVVSDITEIHKQRAHDSGMEATNFRGFLQMINMVRRFEGLPRLYWDAPEVAERKRHLPPQWQTDQVRFALKRYWFDALWRWERAAQLLKSKCPLTEDEARLMKNYQRFDVAVRIAGHPRPNVSDILGGFSRDREFSFKDMLEGFYPNAHDIRVAFHLCLASTGWNPSTLLSLDVAANFIEAHPKDPSRYIMTAFKVRSGTEQCTEGLFKSRGSAGGIILELLRRTAPLRAQMQRDYVRLNEQYEAMKLSGAKQSALNLTRQEIVRLSHGLKSPWLYVTNVQNSIFWLQQNKATNSSGLRQNSTSFLDDVVQDINAKQPPDRQLSKLKAGDFRDAFAAYAYRVSGGMVFYVMKVLGHKYPTTTQNYLNNTLINSESERLYRSFSNSLWQEIKIHRRVDPTIIAKWARDGDVTADERMRLNDYRALKRSRIGVACKDPTNPPKNIDPSFKADGRALCHVQRCTLCLEHAVILPESLTGLCKRLVELQHLSSQMSTIAFLESSFGEEKANTEAALNHFDSQEVQTNITLWRTRVANGLHHVTEFDGVQAITR